MDDDADRPSLADARQALAGESRRDGKISARQLRPQQTVRPHGVRVDYRHGLQPAGGGRFRRGGEFSDRQHGGKRRQCHGQNRQAVFRTASAMHAVPQPSVQRLEAKPVLGIERLLPANQNGAREQYEKAGSAFVLGEREFRGGKPKARRCDFVLRAAQRAVEIGLSRCLSTGNRFRTAAG